MRGGCQWAPPAAFVHSERFEDSGQTHTQNTSLHFFLQTTSFCSPAVTPRWAHFSIHSLTVTWTSLRQVAIYFCCMRMFISAAGCLEKDGFCSLKKNRENINEEGRDMPAVIWWFNVIIIVLLNVIITVQIHCIFYIRTFRYLGVFMSIGRTYEAYLNTAFEVYYLKFNQQL